MDTQILIIAPAVAAALILAVWRFSDGRYGKLRPSSEAAAAWETFRIDPEKNYYLSGSDVYPSALLGLDKTWTLETELWKRREMTVEEMRELVGNMRARALEQGTLMHGFDILDEKERKIGEWYSLPGMSIVIRPMGENRVSITTPPLDAYMNR
jgi:hypothetical protein